MYEARDAVLLPMEQWRVVKSKVKKITDNESKGGIHRKGKTIVGYKDETGKKVCIIRGVETFLKENE